MQTMRAMLLEAPHTRLHLANLPVPTAGPGQVLLKVRACGVCHTDLHILDGELAEPKLPLVLGHQIVGTVVRVRAGSRAFQNRATGWECPGWAPPTVPAVIACAARKTCATTQSSPATTWMAVLPNTPWPMSVSAFPCRRLILTLKWLPCCAPA